VAKRLQSGAASQLVGLASAGAEVEESPLFELARILHEAFYYERRKHGIFGSFFEIQTRMYFNTIRPRISRNNLALRVRIFHASTALATKFHAISGLAVEL